MKLLMRVCLLSTVLLLLEILSPAHAPAGRGRPPGGGFRPNPNPGGFRPNPNPGGFRPNPNPGGFRPNPNPGGFHPNPNPGGFRANPNLNLAITRTRILDLGGQLTKTRDPRLLLPELSQARATVIHMDPYVARVALALETQAHRRIHTQTLTSVTVLANAGRWQEARIQAQEELRRQGAPKRGQMALQVIDQLGEQFDALQQLEAILATAEQQGPAELAQALARLNLDRLPVSVRGHVRGLRALAELQVRMAAVWDRPPEAAVLRTYAADLLAATGNRDVAEGVLQDLALKAWLNGYPREAGALLPQDGPAQGAAQMLRDLKALALGKGEAASFPARQALAVGGGPPAGVRALIPEKEVADWQVRAQAPPPEPPPLVQAARLLPELRRQAQAAMALHRQALQEKAQAALKRVQQVQQQLVQADDADALLVAAVEAQLERDLVPAERALAAQGRREGQELNRIVGDLAQARLLEGEAQQVALLGLIRVRQERARALAVLIGAVAATDPTRGGLPSAAGLTAPLSGLGSKRGKAGPPAPKGGG
jgi:hypothetical protein